MLINRYIDFKIRFSKYPIVLYIARSLYCIVYLGLLTVQTSEGYI